jgi:hypothetical protein
MDTGAYHALQKRIGDACMCIRLPLHVLVIQDTVKELRDRYGTDQKPSEDFEQVQALYENLYACERLELAVDEIECGIRSLTTCLADAPSETEVDRGVRERIKRLIKDGEKDLASARGELDTRRPKLAQLKQAKNKHIALTLLLREFPHSIQLEQGVLQRIMDLTWEGFTYKDALAALEAIVDRDLSPS